MKSHLRGTKHNENPPANMIPNRNPSVNIEMKQHLDKHNTSEREKKKPACAHHTLDEPSIRQTNSNDPLGMQRGECVFRLLLDSFERRSSEDFSIFVFHLGNFEYLLAFIVLWTIWKCSHGCAVDLCSISG